MREFKDSGGREWRAWAIVSDSLTATRYEDYLAQVYYTGWIVFETIAGDEKRRLYPIPAGWSELPDHELPVLLEWAQVVVPASALAIEDPEEPVPAPPAANEATPVSGPLAVRTFRYPGGRIWAVCNLRPPLIAGPAVLRFSSGARAIDLHDYPTNWFEYTEPELVQLLRRASPRTAGAPRADGPPRRWNDVEA